MIAIDPLKILRKLQIVHKHPHIFNKQILMVWNVELVVLIKTGIPYSKDLITLHWLKINHLQEVGIFLINHCSAIAALKILVFVTLIIRFKEYVFYFPLIARLFNSTNINITETVYFRRFIMRFTLTPSSSALNPIIISFLNFSLLFWFYLTT